MCLYLLPHPIYQAYCSCNRGFADVHAISHEVEIIQHAAIAIGTLQMCSLFVTTLSSFSMQLFAIRALKMLLVSFTTMNIFSILLLLQSPVHKVKPESGDSRTTILHQNLLVSCDVLE